MEYQIDSRLNTFQQSAETTSTLQELAKLLQQLERVTEDMVYWVKLNPNHQHLHSRHLSNLYEYNKEYARIKVFLINAGKHDADAGKN